jgi:hypothetical protein
MLSIGDSALRARFTAFGVTVRFTARPGCMARRTPRGTSSLEKKPTLFTPEDPLADQMVRPARSAAKLATPQQSMLAKGSGGFITAIRRCTGSARTVPQVQSFIPLIAVSLAHITPLIVVIKGDLARRGLPRVRGYFRRYGPSGRQGG